jgi:signal transduction histidine kinase
LKFDLTDVLIEGAWAQKLVLAFVAWSTLWIVLSDFVLGWFARVHPSSWSLQTEKGLIYVIVSGILLGSAIGRFEQQQEKLRALNDRRLRSLRESGLVGVVGISRDGKINDANGVLSEMVGRRPASLLQLPIEDLIAPTFETERLRAQEEFSKHGRTGLFRCDLLHADSHPVPVIAGRALLGPEGESIAYFLDIAPLLRSEEQRLRLQEQLLQSEKMNALGQFASGVAHNFNNELSIIIGYGAVMHERLAADVTSSAQLQKVLESAERSSKLIQQLLTFGKKQPAHPEIVDASALLRELQPSVRRRLDPRVDLRVEVSPEPQWVRADPSQVARVLISLVNNSRDAMPKGGTLLLAVYPGIRENHDIVTFEVTDNGMGMDDEIAQHIFEPFFTTKIDTGGTGLGLTTAYGMVQQNGGQIEVVSRLGVGTTFKVILPRHGGIPMSASTLTTPRLKSMQGTVLLVEDRDDVRELMTHVLLSSGLEVIPARDGVEAIEAADANNVDLVLSDVVMPRLSGPEAVRVIRERHPTIKVIYVSGSADLIEPNGRDIVMWKPVKPQALLATVRSCLTASDATFNPRAA